MASQTRNGTPPRHGPSYRLALFGGAAEPLEGFVKEGFDVMRLQATGFGALHVFADALYPTGIHGVASERPFFEQALQVAPVERRVENGGEKRLDLRFFPVAERV